MSGDIDFVSEGYIGIPSARTKIRDALYGDLSYQPIPDFHDEEREGKVVRVFTPEEGEKHRSKGLDREKDVKTVNGGATWGRRGGV